MIIYRVEDYEGGGPYNGANSLPYFSVLDSEHQPSPVSDFPDIPGITHESVFGFAKLEQVAFWFQRSLNDLANAGFHVSKYEVTDGKARCSPNQCFFPRSHAKKIGQLPIPEK